MIILRPISELQLVKSKNPSPTVEIQADSLKEQGLYLSRIVSSALARVAEADVDLKCTVYVYGGMSFNFSGPSWSEFLIIEGPQKLLKILYSAFALPGVNVRYGDYLLAKEGTPSFHIQDGRVWQPEDALKWYAVSSEEKASIPLDAASASTEDEAEEEDDDWADVISDDDSENVTEQVDLENTAESVRNSERPSRYRSARSDAKVASIRQTIEETFGLPEGSVALCGPDGRALKGNALIRTLRLRWEK